MRMILVRHGVTPETGSILTGRLPGVPLAPQGRADARIVGQHLATMEIAAAYSSPIRRCRETARLIAEPHGLNPMTDHGVTEADYGSWSGRRLKDLYRLKSWDRLMAHGARFRFPDGETLTEVQQRAVGSVEAMADRHGDDTVLVVSHSDVIRALLCHYLGMNLDLIHRLHVSPTSVSIIHLESTGAVGVPVVNHTYQGGPA